MTAVDVGFQTLKGEIDQTLADIFGNRGGCPFPGLPDVAGDNELIAVVDDIWHDVAVRVQAPGHPASVNQATINANLSQASLLQEAMTAYVYQRVIDYYNAAITYANSAAGAAQAAAEQYTVAVVSPLLGSLSAISGGLAGVYNAAVAYTNQQVGSLARSTQSQITTLYRLEVSLAGDLKSGLSSVVSYSQQLYRQAVTHADAVAVQQATAARLSANGYTNHQANILEQQIQSVHNQIAPAVTAGLATAGATAAKLATQAATQATTALQNQLAPEISKLQQETAECLDPLCNTVTPNSKGLGDLGKLLTALESGALLGLLLALLVEGAEHPAGLVADVEHDLGGFASDIFGEFRSEIGV